ncbi:Transposase, IS116/IS110/IS902, partial [gut metagenome]
LYSKSLQTIKGCGFVTSMIIALEIGEIERFNTHKDFVSYCRLAPTSKLSNGKVQGCRQREERERLLELGFHGIGQPSSTLQS